MNNNQRKKVKSLGNTHARRKFGLRWLRFLDNASFCQTVFFLVVPVSRTVFFIAVLVSHICASVFECWFFYSVALKNLK